MKKELATFVCASVLLGSAQMALAGAYGDEEKAEESPAPVQMSATEEAAVEQKSYFYLQGGVVYSIELFDYPSSSFGPSSDVDNGWGYDLRAGYRINDMFAAEVQAQHIAGGFDFEETSPSLPPREVETWAITANGKLYPLQGRFQPFALVGVGYEHADIDAPGAGGGPDGGGFAARFGVGVDFRINDNLGLEVAADYLLTTGAISKHTDQIPLSVGFYYNFL